MDIKVDISPEQINQAVASAIIKSALGMELEKQITAEVAKFSTSYNNPLAKIIGVYVEDATRRVVEEQYADQIKAWVAEKVTEQFTAEMFQKMWDTFARRY